MSKKNPDYCGTVHIPSYPASAPTASVLSSRSSDSVNWCGGGGGPLPLAEAAALLPAPAASISTSPPAPDSILHYEPEEDEAESLTTNIVVSGQNANALLPSLQENEIERTNNSVEYGQ